MMPRFARLADYAALMPPYKSGIVPLPTSRFTVRAARLMNSYPQPQSRGSDV